MDKIKIFLDTDVVISSLLSSTGASHEVIFNTKCYKMISNLVVQEINEVVERDNLIVNIEETLQKLEKINIRITKISIINFKKYVSDEEDIHIILGAIKSKAKFLLTHNLKHYKLNKIHNDYALIVLKPGNFLQYLRSLN